MSRGSFIITQKENKGEYGAMNCGSDSCVANPEWKWNTADSQDIYAHVVDQNGPSDDDGTPYRYKSVTSFGSNVCTGDAQITHGSTAYSSISEQISCNPSTLNAGNYYSFPAATAGAPATTGTTLNSICPKGWQLPPNAGDKSYNTLIHTAYNISDTASDTTLLANSAMSFVRLGLYYCDYGSLYNRSGNGYYWSSTASSATNSRYLYFGSGALGPQNNVNRARGLSIRCVSR